MEKEFYLQRLGWRFEAAQFFTVEWIDAVEKKRKVRVIDWIFDKHGLNIQQVRRWFPNNDDSLWNHEKTHVGQREPIFCSSNILATRSFFCSSLMLKCCDIFAVFSLVESRLRATWMVRIFGSRLPVVVGSLRTACSNEDYCSPILCLGVKQRTPSPSSVAFFSRFPVSWLCIFIPL